VIENPIWKTSYRLVLSPKGEEKPYLQGWAVVENPSDEDWKDVRMALVSGRPISFQMDLYTPLYVPRPTETLELFAGLRSVAYSGSMDNRVLITDGTSNTVSGVAEQWGRLSERERGKRAAVGESKPGENGAAGRILAYANETTAVHRDLQKRMDLG